MAETDNNPSLPPQQAILQTALKIARQNPNLDDASLLTQAEEATATLFQQLGAKDGPSAKDSTRSKGRLKRKRHERKDHVGRFFLRMMEKELRHSKILPCLVPIFSSSVQELLGEDNYQRLSEKIMRLLDFGEKKGFDYDKILDSKPGKGITAEIMALYRIAAQGSYFEKKLKNDPDQELVHFVRQNPDETINLEDSINSAFDQFLHLLEKPSQAPAA